MKEEIVIAGYGGQGIVFLGKVLANFGLLSGKYVTMISSYGAEMRGGTAFSMVIISDDEIASPIVEKPNTVIAMNQPSYNKYYLTVKTNGKIIVNSSLVKNFQLNSREDIQCISVPASELAVQLGDIRLANMVLFGVYLRVMNLNSLEIAKSAIEKTLPEEKKCFLTNNLSALETGFFYLKT